MSRKVIAVAVVLLTLWFGVIPGWGQAGDVEEANQLSQKLIQLYQQGNYTEAARIGEQVLAIIRKKLRPGPPQYRDSP